MPLGDSAERLVRALQNALAADVDPRPRGHLPVHRETETFELAELLPRRPAPDEIAVRDEHTGRGRLCAKYGDGLAALHEQGLVSAQPTQRRDDRVECLPRSSRPA